MLMLVSCNERRHFFHEKMRALILLPPVAVTLTLPIRNYYYYSRLMAFLQDNLGKPAPER